MGLGRRNRKEVPISSSSSDHLYPLITPHSAVSSRCRIQGDTLGKGKWRTQRGTLKRQLPPIDSGFTTASTRIGHWPTWCYYTSEPLIHRKTVTGSGHSVAWLMTGLKIRWKEPKFNRIDELPLEPCRLHKLLKQQIDIESQQESRILT